MKAIGIKMIDLQPMTAREANDKGISENEMFKTLSEYEQKDMRDQLFHMN